jgi:hypothetical protein
VRGRIVEAHREALQRRIEQIRTVVRDTLNASAREMVGRLDPAPPPVAQGYQLVPRFVNDAPQPLDTIRSASVYSWPWTDTLIKRDHERIDLLERLLVENGKDRPAYDRLVNTFNKIAIDRRLIDAHVEHNWMWQRAIAADTARFARTWPMIDSSLRGILPPVIAVPAMPRVQMVLDDSGPGPVTIHIPVVTDIEDSSFVRAARTTIERIWTGTVNGRVHQVRLDIRVISPQALYCAASNAACSPLSRGAPVDIASHLARFPADVAVLTTGGTQPYVLGGRAMILGPRDLSYRTFGHEFGHVLGFDDAYLRSFRSIGQDGYEVIELITDRADIMAASGYGSVLSRHFPPLVANLRAERAMRAGLVAMYDRKNPRDAVGLFREVLANRSDHYGANFQLAKALDQSGDSTAAGVAWRRVLELARAAGDSTTAATASSRLKVP